MKRKKRIILALNLLLGGFVVSTLSGCEGEVSPFYTLELNFDSTLGSVTSETPQGAVGDTVTVKITPNEGIVIDSVKVNGEEVDVDDTGVLTFTAIGGKNTVDVAFKDPTVQPPLDASFSVKAEFDSQMGTVTLKLQLLLIVVILFNQLQSMVKVEILQSLNLLFNQNKVKTLLK